MTAQATIQHPEEKIGHDERCALICCHEASYSTFLAKQARDLGYKVHHAQGHASGQERIAGRNYHLTVLLENLEGCQLANHALLAHLSSLPTNDRRATYIVLLCQSFATGDDRAAYALGVNLLINYQDVNQFAEILAPAIEEYAHEDYHFRLVAERMAA
jgi:hypothetical protein